MGLGVLLIHKMGIVGAYQLDAIFVSQLDQLLVDRLLLLEGLAVGTDGGVFHLMAHQLQIVVVAKHAPIPLNGLAGTSHVASH